MSLKNLPFATALTETLSEGYPLSRFKKDLIAAFVVSLVALPLSMALSIAVGLPPQHGLYTTIVAGIVAPLVGGSKLQVSGPTAAFVVILAPIVQQYGLHGLIWCQLIAGVLLLLFAFAKLGRLISFVPYPVTTGFTAGIAVILGVISLNDFLGLGLNLSSGHFPEKLALLASNLGKINIYETAVGLVALVLIAGGQRIIKGVPTTILGVGAAFLLAALFAKMGHPVETIGTRFSFVDAHGATQAGIPPYAPSFSLPTTTPGQLLTIPDLAEFKTYLYPALVVALLAGLESLLSATVADSLTGARHKPNAELYGVGAANIASGLAAGIPATGAIARTATLINNGGTSPFACMYHAVFVLVFMLLLSPYISMIPMAALAAILIHTAYRMSHWRQFMHVCRIAPRADVVVMLACFALTVVIDMVAGVSVGMALAALLLMKQVTELTKVELEGHEEEGKRPEHLPEGTLLYRVSGPLFFSTAEKLLDQTSYLMAPINVLIVDMEDVDFVDMSGLAALGSLLDTVAKNKRTVILVGRPPVLAAVKRQIGALVFMGNVVFEETLDQALSLVRQRE